MELNLAKTVVSYLKAHISYFEVPTLQRESRVLY